MNEAIIHATCTRIREAKGLSECYGCPERDVIEREWSGAIVEYEGEPLCHFIARQAWDKAAEND
jgi:hypothetical protein